MLRYYIAFSFLLVCSSIKAQKSIYTNQTEIGILAGVQTLPSFTFQTFNGVKFSNSPFQVGVTAGLDVYSQIKIIPLAVGMRLDIFKSNSVNLYSGIDFGYGFTWLERKTETEEFDGGYMLNPCLGLRFKTNGSSLITLSLGFKRQLASFNQAQKPNPFNFDIFPGYALIQQDDYKFNRISLKMGIASGQTH